jgi:hypothetical protein
MRSMLVVMPLTLMTLFAFACGGGSGSASTGDEQDATKAVPCPDDSYCKSGYHCKPSARAPEYGFCVKKPASSGGGLSANGAPCPDDSYCRSGHCKGSASAPEYGFCE